tara:strand:- start:408 stop:683 length:276 start_codon:yes stop_codon:yes gene_type:complete
MALGIGISMVVGGLVGQGTAATATVIEDYMWEAASATDITPVPTTFDFNDSWDLDGNNDYMPQDPVDDEGYWEISGSDLTPIDTTVFPYDG